MAVAAASKNAMQGMINSQSSSDPAAGQELPPAVSRENRLTGSRLLAALMAPEPKSETPETDELMEDMQDALWTLKTSDQAHRSIIELISFTAKPLVIEAMFSTDPAESARCAAGLKDILDQITEICEASHNTYLEYSTSK